MILQQTWLTTSGITGLTFPGMIEDPGCLGKVDFVESPARPGAQGRRGSLQTLESLMLIAFRTPAYRTYAWVSWGGFDQVGGSRISRFMMREMAGAIPLRSPGAFRPVPIAVPPILVSRRAFCTIFMACTSSSGVPREGFRFLPERHGDGILKLGFGHLDDAGEDWPCAGRGRIRRSSSSISVQLLRELRRQ